MNSLVQKKFHAGLTWACVTSQCRHLIITSSLASAINHHHPWYHCHFHQFCYPDYRNHRLNESANPTVPALRECIFHHHQYQCDNLDEVFKPGQLNTCWSDLAYCEAPPPSLSSSPPRAQECRTVVACPHQPLIDSTRPSKMEVSP